MSFDSGSSEFTTPGRARGARLAPDPADNMADAIVSDVDLVKRCQGADETAYEALVERYRRRAYWVAFHMVGDAEEAWDITQEAFLRVFRNIHSFDLDRNFHTWLYRIVSNLCIDSLRKRSGEKAVEVEDLNEFIPGGARPEAVLANRELSTEIEQCLQQLPPRYRSVIVLRDINELSCKEIAKIVGCTHATVRWRLHRARKMFRALWEKSGRPAPGSGPARPDHGDEC
jgi:RNA polymerase sigma-70 factor (ECF subfamily)